MILRIRIRVNADRMKDRAETGHIWKTPSNLRHPAPQHTGAQRQVFLRVCGLPEWEIAIGTLLRNGYLCGLAKGKEALWCREIAWGKGGSVLADAGTH